MNAVLHSSHLLQRSACCGTVGHMKSRLLIVFVAGAVAGIAATGAVIFYSYAELPEPQLSSIVAESQEKRCPIHEEHTLYFVDENHPDYKNTCGATSSVVRCTGNDLIEADTVLRLLLGGVTNEESERGLTSWAFESMHWYPEGTKSLAAYYRGMDVSENGMATLHFTSEAMAYLNASACIQEAIKLPIYHTLRALPSIAKIQFAIDGEVVTEWDA